ncbi:MAG: ferritin family protein [Candidatus Eisenbacteria bacterium]|nr:ferritin family protein [Candidatus Eisenbacteria bacterium]
MSNFGSIDEVLDFAVKREEESERFYLEMAKRVEKMKEVFEQFAAEERGHKAKLLAVKENKRLVAKSSKPVQDLKIGDYLEEKEATPGMDYADALVLAMKKEKKAFKLYSDLAASAESGETAELFRGLAQEEARHKLRFEVEYDDYVLREN